MSERSNLNKDARREDPTEGVPLWHSASRSAAQTEAELLSTPNTTPLPIKDQEGRVNSASEAYRNITRTPKTHRCDTSHTPQHTRAGFRNPDTTQ